MSWTYKLQGDPSQISQHILNQPIEIDKLNHIGGLHAATNSAYVRGRKGKYEWVCRACRCALNIIIIMKSKSYRRIP